MDRMDSGFDESYSLKEPEPEPHCVHRSNTAPTRCCKPKNASPEIALRSPSSGMNTQRPASERNSTDRRKSTDPRQLSLGSSSEHSTTKSRGHRGSKPSSRRTSCTVIDPSRPARHYRIKSSHTVPSVTRDVDDVLALHFRSCSLFQNPSYHAAHPEASISRHGPGLVVNTDLYPTIVDPIPTTSPLSIDTISMTSPKQSEDTMAPLETTNTVTHWMSPSTRRREYEEIDRENSGIRIFIRKMVPRCVSGPPPPRFYEQDTSDTGSVRRYRMDVPEDEADEKVNGNLRLQSRRVERAAPRDTVKKTKRWGCF
ncbi:hypothetical protein CC78DRAFT_378037 [Lojkania enalia]|uniref:Uncharacterized protein n=1 Tax=Lojkania enalia TaxID=147567 RepID=A0A9P4N3K9_9PLEO|nr:hypothetical protein CC78DRAFT_378037 [Didymosphaeria enalia]